MLVLQLEDLAHPLLEARQSVAESKEELVAKVLSVMTPTPGAEDKFPALMSVRKGKVSLNPKTMLHSYNLISLLMDYFFINH